MIAHTPAIVAELRTVPDTLLSPVMVGRRKQLAALHAGTGLDHLALSAPTRAELDAWRAYLTAKGVECSEIKDITEPLAFSLFSFTDPDGVALEIFYMDQEV